MMARASWLLAGVLATFVVASASAGFVDTFDSIDPGWVTDRYAPAGFSSAAFDGDNRLKIDISTADSAANRPGAYSGAFYNTQGRQRAVDATPTWCVTGDIYVSSDMLTGNNLRRTDLWARTGQVGTETGAQYPIIGLRRFDSSDPFNPNAGSIDTKWRVWDEHTVNGWVELADAVTAGWHTLSIVGDGSSFEYLIDGTSVYTDTTINAALPDLTTVFVQAYNFGDSNYSVYWDNVMAGACGVIPAPGAIVLGALGLSLVQSLRRRFA